MENPTIHLHIDTLIGKFVVINIPSEDNKNSYQSPTCSAEALKRELVCALKEALSEIDKDIEIFRKEHLDNILQKKHH